MKLQSLSTGGFERQDERGAGAGSEFDLTNLHGTTGEGDFEGGGDFFAVGGGGGDLGKDLVLTAGKWAGADLKAGDARVHHFGQGAVDEGDVAFRFGIAGDPDFRTGIEFSESASGGERLGGISGDGFRL